MGLDQHAHKVKRSYDEDTRTETTVKTEIAYWRKHNALEGYMANLYRTKTGDTSEFNCKTLHLNLDDLNNLEATVRSGTLPETTGFFFGGSTALDEQRKENDLHFIAEARVLIEQGWEIEYTSWW